MSNNQSAIKDVNNKEVKIKVVKIIKVISILSIFSFLISKWINLNIINNIYYQDYVLISVCLYFLSITYLIPDLLKSKKTYKLLKILDVWLVMALIIIMIGNLLINK